MIKKTLQNKNIIVTGGSSGIGAEIGLNAARREATPVMLARSIDKLKDVSSRIQKETDVEPFYYPLDVRDDEAVASVFQQILTDVGNIDILVNNAGFAIFDYFRDADLEAIRNMMNVNVFGLMACTRILLPHMLDNKQGQIINMVSQAGKVPTPKSTVYAATKHAALGFTNGLRMELAGTNIDVTAVNPGPIRTNFLNIADPTGDYIKNIQSYILEPDVVAKKVVHAMEKPKREVNMPFTMNTGSRIYQMFPGLVEKLVSKMFDRK